MNGLRQHVQGAVLRWRDLELATQYLIASVSVVLLVSAVSGMLISAVLNRSAIDDRSERAALFLEGVFANALQDVADDGALSSGSVAYLDAVMANADFAGRFPYLEVWLPTGQIVYSNSPMLMGRQLALPVEAEHAFAGAVRWTFADLGAEEHTLRRFQSPLLEVYAPVHRLGSDEVIAVVEIHETAETLEHSLNTTNLLVWSLVVAGALVAIIVLFGIVQRGSRTIQAQRIDLAERLKASLHLRAQVGEVQNAAFLAEKRLKLASADLHDGPSQLINFALLKAQESALAKTPAERARILNAMQTSLITALSEIRSISHGLILPDIANLSLDAIVDLAIEAHEARTGASVIRQGQFGAAHAGLETQIALYRIAQEGLNNAFRHSQKSSVTISCEMAGQKARIELRNAISTARPREPHELSGMGLDGLKARVEILDGTFVARRIGDEFSLEVCLDVERHDD
jgi:signal transduction histidine kinase